MGSKVKRSRSRTVNETTVSNSSCLIMSGLMTDMGNGAHPCSRYKNKRDSGILTPFTPSSRTTLLSVSGRPVIFSPIRRRVGFSFLCHLPRKRLVAGHGSRSFRVASLVMLPRISAYRTIRTTNCIPKIELNYTKKRGDDFENIRNLNR